MGVSVGPGVAVIITGVEVGEGGGGLVGVLVTSGVQVGSTVPVGGGVGVTVSVGVVVGSTQGCCKRFIPP
jgi:hypothetical protein